MADHTVSVRWERGVQVFTDNRYSRRHLWTFDGGAVVPASSSPQVVPEPCSDAGAVDPEEAFVASLSSCHMLWFLSLAVKHGYCVDSYADSAVGILEKDATDRPAITVVTLRPAAVFSGELLPSLSALHALHQEAHDQCFLANSVKTEVRCEPIYSANPTGKLEGNSS